MLDESLASLARRIPGATAVFHEYKLDFCCGGQHSLKEAAQKKSLSPEAIAARLEKLQATPGDDKSWLGAGNAALIQHILERFHERHREQLPELIRLARRVEQVHREHPACPHGLADQLSAMQQELFHHMMKEEQVLFPMLQQQGLSAMRGPITMMRMEHEQHGIALATLDHLTQGFSAPEGACNTWRALYLGLATLRDDVMQHIHLENNILFEGLAEPAHKEPV